MPVADIQQIDLQSLSAELRPKWYERTTFKEYFGMWMAIGALGVVAVLILAFFALWATTRPSVADARFMAELLQQPPIEVLRDLRAEHFEQYADAFQLFVLSGMVPLFTLLAGYTFGSARRKDQDAGEE
jgi:hypothetical protein